MSTQKDSWSARCGCGAPICVRRPFKTVARLAAAVRSALGWRGPAAAAAALAAAIGCAPSVRAGDWAQWRHDAGRTAASSEELAAELHLQWVRRLPTPRPAWPKHPRLCFDASYQPIVMDGTVFVSSMVSDSVIALDADTGVEKWRFYTDGPVRLAPAAANGRVYFVSDDGFLVCLDADDGELVWRFSKVPEEWKGRKVLGNDRLISLWPARGGPVIADGTVYFGAGVFPFEGVGVFAVDAESGKLIWSNEAIGEIKQALTDHSMRQDGGLSPQGYLAVIGDKLIVPSGRALAAVLDRRSGQLLPYTTGWGGRDNLAKGCWYACGTSQYMFQSGEPYSMATRARLDIDPANAKELGQFREPILTPRAAYFSLPVNRLQGYRPAGRGYEAIVCWDLTQPPQLHAWKDDQDRQWKTGSFRELWRLPSPLKAHIKAGGRLYAGGEGIVAAVDIPESDQSPKISWRAEIEGAPSSMLAADGKLVVTTRSGSLYVFGPKPRAPDYHAASTMPQQPQAPDRQASRAAEKIIAATGVKDGYGVLFGTHAGRLAVELARRSNLHLIVLSQDREAVRGLRNMLTNAGLYGTRIAVHQGDPASYELPPYLASLIVCAGPLETDRTSGEILLKRLYRSLRPYGGAACLPLSDRQHAALADLTAAASFPGVELSRSGKFTLMRREGPPAGAANWTHEDADAASSLVSRDQRVKPPLGVLWFGGAIDMLFPDWDFTHSRSATPLVAGGRMFFQVFPKLNAVDIYTGRPLWTVRMPGTDADANRRNIRYAAAEESVYVVAGRTCHRLDAATGASQGQFPCPGKDDRWREIRIWNDCLIGATGRSLVCMDRLDGKLKWTHAGSENELLLSVGADRVFCADFSLPDRRGRITEPRGSLVALDARSGRELWRADLQLVGPFQKPPRLAYSEERDILIAALGVVTAYDGRSGKRLWGGKPIEGGEQPMLHHDELISQAGEVYDLRTGARSPKRLFEAKRRGCTRVIGGEYFLSIRDAHASYLDPHTGRQTFFRGVRTGCTNSLIQAGGLLNSPNFAYGCACNYPVFSSLALVHLDEKE